MKTITHHLIAILEKDPEIFYAEGLSKNPDEPRVSIKSIERFSTIFLVVESEELRVNIWVIGQVANGKQYVVLVDIDIPCQDSKGWVSKVEELFYVFRADCIYVTERPMFVALRLGSVSGRVTLAGDVVGYQKGERQ
jgi:hypothetical protein